MKPEQILSHSGLRGAAALLVVAYHLQLNAPYRLAAESAHAFFTNGYLWVDLFFILSGFIIRHANVPDRAHGFSGARVKSFAVARIARLYPLHLFCLAYLVAFIAASDLGLALLGRSPPADHWSRASMTSLFVQIGLLQVFDVSRPPGWNVPSWSISAELVAYATFPALTALALRFGRAASIVLCLVSALFYAIVVGVHGSLDTVYGVSTLRCLAGFFLGFVLYGARASVASVSGAALSIGQLSLAAAIVAIMALDLDDILIVIPFAALVLAVSDDRGVVARMLGAPPMVRLGELSYSIYLNHVCIIVIIGFFWWRIEQHLSFVDQDILRALWLALALSVTLAASMFTYRFVELPGRAYVRRRLPLSR